MGHRSRRWPALLALLAVVLSGLALAPTASAAPEPVTAATLDWAVSNYVGTSSSLQPSRTAGAPATVDATGWSFTGGTGTYDPDTGAVSVSYSGSIEFGNTVQGNYGFRFSDPEIVVEAGGAGRLVADVATRGPGGPTFGDPVPDVTIVTFTAGAGTVAEGVRTWTVTPDTEDVATATPAFEGAQQFPASLFAAITNPGLHGHFRQTSADGPTAAANINKLPAPITFSVPEPEVAEPAPAPSITVTPATGLGSGDTVTIDGSGFVGDGIGVYVRLCAAVDGEVGTPEGRPNADRCLGNPQHWVSNAQRGPTAPMGADGTFSVSLVVPSSFVVGEQTFDCAAVTCGIAVRRDHLGGEADFSYDAFAPIAFAAGTTDPDPDPGPGTPPAEAPTAGNLDWGVKANFRNYILHGPAAGTIDTADGATTLSDGTFRFPIATGGHYTSSTDLSAPFTGTVRFEGHEGLLQVEIADPVVEISGTTGQLVADVESRSLATGETASWEDVAFADLDLSSVQPTASGKVVTFAQVPAALTEEGAEAFAGFYAAGEALDPVTFALEVADPGDLPGTDDPDPNADLVGCVPASIVAGSSVEVCGGGFIPGEQVQVVLHSDPIVLGVLTAGADGRASGAVTVPTTAVAGVHTVELRGVTSGRSIMSAPVTVVAAVPTQAVPTQATTLASTGSDAGDLAVLGVALLGAGLVLSVASRRRRVVAGS